MSLAHTAHCTNSLDYFTAVCCLSCEVYLTKSKRLFLHIYRYFNSHRLLVEQRLERDKLPEVVRESDVALR